MFLWTPGADPMTVLLQLTDKMDRNDSSKLLSISLGQGQGPRAEEAIAIGRDKGLWICLQNCGLGESWLPRREKFARRLLQKYSCVFWNLAHHDAVPDIFSIIVAKWCKEDTRTPSWHVAEFAR